MSLLLEKKLFSQKIIDRFESSFIPIDTNQCWVWTKCKDKDGYGKFKIRINNLPYHLRAHRVSAALYLAPVPLELIVMHKCDNPSCVNPNHLHIGTHLENEQDKDKKGRRRIWNTLLNKDQVTTILTRLIKGDRIKIIAKEYKVSVGCIHSITSGGTWKNITGSLTTDEFEKMKTLLKRRGSRHVFAKLSEEDVLEIRERSKNGESNTELAKFFKIHPNTISTIKRRISWKHLS
jgi:hypothetical protein